MAADSACCNRRGRATPSRGCRASQHGPGNGGALSRLARGCRAGWAILLLISSGVSSLASGAAIVRQETPLEYPSDDATVPGGEGFVRSVLGMDGAEPDLPGGFLVAVAYRLSLPSAIDLQTRLQDAWEELAELQAELEQIEASFRGVVGSLATPDTAAYRKGRAILDAVGFNLTEGADGIQVRRRVGDRETRRRRLLSHLGISAGLQTRLWTDGEPIRVEIADTTTPVLFGTAAWNEQVFERDLAGSELVAVFVDDERARTLLLAYALLDAPTRELLFQEVGLRRFYADQALTDGFLRLAPYLRARDGGLSLPGGSRPAWEAILGRWSDEADLLRRLTRNDRGRPGALWRALSLVSDDLANYLLTLGADRDATVAWAVELYEAIKTPDFGNGIGWPEDPAELFVRLRLQEDGGGIAWPGGAQPWLAALRGDVRLEDPGASDRALAQVSGRPESGPSVDRLLLVGLIDGSDPRRSEPSAIRKFLTVVDALRYQPPVTAGRSIPLLYAAYPAYGTAYGTFVMPVPLSAATIGALIRRLAELDRRESPVPRIESIRQLQATLMLLRQMLINGAIPSSEADPLFTKLVATDPGTPLLEWWRDELVPIVGGALVASGWPDDPEDPRAVLVAGLVGRMERTALEVDGIPYEFAPARFFGRRMQTNVSQQAVPRLDQLMELDSLVMRVASLVRDGGGRRDDSRGGSPGALADRLDGLVEAIRQRIPANVARGEVDEALPVPVGRDQLFPLAEGVARGLREGDLTAGALTRLRGAIVSFLGDSLVGTLYGLHMGDPRSFLYRHPHVPWLHQLEPAERSVTTLASLYGPWAATSEAWIGNEGTRLQNSLFGVPENLARWNLGLAMPSGGAREPIAEEIWGATAGYLHVPTLNEAVHGLVTRRYQRATDWIMAAVRAHDPDLPPPGAASEPPPTGANAPTAGDPEAPALAGRGLITSLDRLLYPHERQRLVDAVRAGDADRALALVSAGNRYLLARSIDRADERYPADLRWALDQAVGMPLGRRGDYLGLGLPPAVPYGEAGQPLADPLLYSRILDVRVELAVAMQRLQLPANMQGRLLIEAMAEIIGSVPATSLEGWRDMLASAGETVSTLAVRDWVVDMAFNDELDPTDPLADRDAAGGDRSDRSTSALSLPDAPAGPSQAAFAGRVDLVLVDVGVWDDDGDFVSDLTLEEFEVRWGGRPIQPAFLRIEGDPLPSIFLDDLPADVAAAVETTSRNFVLVADMLTTSSFDWERILDETLEFVDAGISVDDRLALVTIDQRGQLEVVEGFTLDHPRVAEALEGLRGNAFGDTLQRAVQDLGRTLCDNSGCFDDDPANCEAQSFGRFPSCVTAAVDWESQKINLAQGQLGRWINDERAKSQQVVAALDQVGTMLDFGDPFDRSKIIVLLSSGFEVLPGNVLYQTLIDYTNVANDVLSSVVDEQFLDPADLRRPSEDLGDELESLADLMHRCRCRVYTIASSGLGTFAEGPGVGQYANVVSGLALRQSLQDSLNAIARDTGGVPFFGPDPALGFRDVLEDSRLRYVIGFEVSGQGGLPAGLTEASESTWHQLEVEVLRPGLRVRAREGFFWPPRR